MLKLFRKDLILFFHDQRSVIIAFLLPVILITLFAFAYGSLGAYSGLSQPVKLLVADLDKSTASGEILNRIDSLDNIKVIASDSAKARELVIRGKYASALVIHKGFQDSLNTGNPSLLELVYDRSREMEIGILRQDLISLLISSTSEIVMKKNFERSLKELFPDNGAMISENFFSSVNGNGWERQTIKWTPIVGIKNDIRLGLIQAVAGTAILMLLFSVAGIGTSILEEKENGTIHRLLYSPLNGNIILYSKMLFAFFISVIQLSLMFIFAWLAFNLDLTVNFPALVLMILSTSFAVSSLGIFLAAVARTRLQAQNMSTIIILVMSAIGGSMIPMFIMPPILQKIALLSVNYWAIQGFYDIFWRNLPLSEILPKIFVLISFGIVVTYASIVLFKKRVISF